MDVDTHWQVVKKIFRQSFSSSFHCSIASVDEDGKPHVTPIGSLMSGNLGHAIYFEEFTSQLPKNPKTNKQVCIMAVNSGKWFWLQSLVAGRFSEPPALRLQGEAGILREATEMELQRWHKRLWSLGLTKGHRIMWQRMGMVREIKLSSIRPVHIGAMTSNNWSW